MNHLKSIAHIKDLIEIRDLFPNQLKLFNPFIFLEKSDINNFLYSIKNIKNIENNEKINKKLEFIIEILTEYITFYCKEILIFKKIQYNNSSSLKKIIESLSFEDIKEFNNCLIITRDQQEYIVENNNWILIYKNSFFILNNQDIESLTKFQLKSIDVTISSILDY